MLFRFLVIASIISAASAAGKSIELPTNDITSTSRLGRSLLSKARALDGNNDFSWVAGYSLKFEKCATSQDYYGGNGNNDNNRNNYNGMYQQRLVHFKLCPSNSCSSCEGGADYVIDMNEFVDAYQESKLTAQEYNCERIRENCYCENANDDERCEYQCYVTAGVNYCFENNNNNGQQNEFNLEEALECQKMDVDKDAINYYFYQNGGQNRNYYNGQQGGEMELFVGPYCSTNGKKIFLGVFTDETCSFAAPEGIYEKLNYGQSLPYSKQSLVENNCISCAEPTEYDEQNYYDQQDADEVTDVCERLYEDAGKCETGMNIYNPNTYACNFIQTLKASGGLNSVSVYAVAHPSKVLAGVFAATTVIFAGTACYLHSKVQRSKVNLSEQGNGQLA